MDFSLIIPCYNEEENLRVFIPTAIARLEALDASCEMVFVDDGSSDATFQVIEEQIAACEKQVGRSDERAAAPRRGGSPQHDGAPAGSGGDAAIGGNRLSFRIIGFSRNFGKESAMFAGLEQASGDVLGFIDADMQQDPAVAVRMFNVLKEDPSCDCVAAVQERRRESLPMRALKRLFYRMFKDMSDLDIVEGASDFRVFTRQVADALLSLREHFRFSKGLFSWVGFSTRVVTYKVHDRYAGKSKWTLRDLFGYAWNGVVAFSTWPLRMAMVLGVVLAIVSLVLLGIDFVDSMVLHDGVSMGRVLVYVVLLMGGIQMMVLGVFGEYLARAYLESKKRPLYIVRRVREIKAR